MRQKLETFKLSLNLTETNKPKLDELVANCGMKYGPMINKIIDTFCNMSETQKKIVEDACLSAYKELSTELENTSEEFYKSSIEQDMESFHEILKILNGGTYNLSRIPMKRIELADGYLLIPEDWIVVNPEEAPNCRYASVMECKNGEKYDVPHFIYLHNYNYNEEPLPRNTAEHFYDLCEEAWSNFSEIRKLSKNPDKEAPIVGAFPIHEQYDGSDHPYGVMIVRD